MIRLKRCIGIIIAVLSAVLYFNCLTVFADDITVLTSGSCGYNGADVTYTLTSDGVFTVSGTGYMDNYYPDENEQPTMPWINYRDNIKEIVIEDGVLNVSYGGFVYCNYLTKVTLAPSVINLDPDCFFGCALLTDINCENVDYVGEAAFAYCSVLNNVDFSKATQICKNAFAHCLGLTDITLGEGLKTIGETAFYNCTALQNIALPESVSQLNNGSFLRCTGLESISIPSGVSSIPQQAFYGCTNLKSVNLADNVKAIEYGAFAACTVLESINLENVTSIGQFAFYQCSKLNNIRLSEELSSLGGAAFEYCTSLESINLGKITSIPQEAFASCEKLNNVIIPETCTSIALAAFSRCYSLENIDLSNVTSIGQQSFYYCTKLNRVILPETVTNIGIAAFACCTSLTSVELPENVSSMGVDIFYQCSSLKCVYLYEDTYADTFIAENSSGIQRKYITQDNAVAISNLDTENNTFTVLVDTDKLGGNPETAQYLEAVNVLVNDDEQGAQNYRYVDDTQKYIAFDVQYTNTSGASIAAVRGESVTLSPENSNVFKYYVTKVLNIEMGGN